MLRWGMMTDEFDTRSPGLSQILLIVQIWILRERHLSATKTAKQVGK